MNVLKLFVTGLVIVAKTCYSQGTFQNLDFEQANPGAIGTGNSASVLFPSWQLLIGAAQTSTAGYDPEFADSQPSFWISDDKTGGYEPIQGNYTAFLQSVAVGGGVSVSLVQTAVLPSAAESIELDAFEQNNSSFVLTFDGKDVNMEPLQTFQNYTVYGGNVSEWSGQDATLSITQLSPSSSGVSSLELDDISFSPNPITVTPEPDPVLLMGIGGALFAAYRRFAPKRK